MAPADRLLPLLRELPGKAARPGGVRLLGPPCARQQRPLAAPTPAAPRVVWGMGAWPQPLSGSLGSNLGPIAISSSLPLHLMLRVQGLKRRALPHIRPLPQEQQVDGDLLLRLTEEELQTDLGMKSGITRKR